MRAFFGFARDAKCVMFWRLRYRAKTDEKHRERQEKDMFLMLTTISREKKLVPIPVGVRGPR
jgi:hypothetical protein